MSIKGTLETFNLCELLQMLAFNKKEGTLVLEAEGGTRTLFLDQGQVSFLQRDAEVAARFLRLLRQHEIGDAGQQAAAAERHEADGTPIGEQFRKLGLLDEAYHLHLHREALLEQLFECQLTAVAGFEFVEGKALLPDGSDDRPAKPLLPVESLLLDLARMLDHWNTVTSVVPGPGEIYEGTGIAVDLAEQEDIDPDVAAQVIPLIDGRRTLTKIAEQVHATPYAVMQIAATLFEGGGIRAVPTDDLVRRAEDLLARGEAADTIALFQRCIDRGDADLTVRLRLADALEACGRLEDAAAELDTFAALSDEGEAKPVFDALCRALRLRGGDLATAARTCDYYLRRRPWLQDERPAAQKALRELITAATTQGRPTDAALRLQGFIDVGDAPAEDRTLLADLYAAGGARKEAADALYRRSEDLLATDRTAPARQLLRRALELDPGHADARRRTMELEGVRRRRGHRARIALILLALGGVASAAGVAWFGYRDTSSTELVDAQAQAEMGFTEAEGRAQELIRSFAARAEAVEAEGRKDPALADDATSMREEVRAIMASTTSVLATYRTAIEEAQAAGQADRHREELARMQQRATVTTKQAAQAVNALIERAQTALGQAHDRHTRGEFREALRLLRSAWSLSFADPGMRADAARKLELVDAYMERYETLRAEVESRTAQGDLAGAFAVGVDALGELLDSDLTRSLPFPVAVTSEPSGAAVWLGAEDTGLRTPCVLTYSPFVEDLELRLRMGGRTPAHFRLPGFAQISRDPDAVKAFEPKLHATLSAGPRWTIDDKGSRFSALWVGRGMPLVAGDAGHGRYAVAPRDGACTLLGRTDPTRDGIRLAGRFDGGAAWAVTGHRTVTVRTRSGEPWSQVTSNRIEFAPIERDGLVIVADARIVYAYRLADGTPAWHCELSGVPMQAPVSSALGLLVGTNNGNAWRIAVKDGSWEALAPAAAGPVLALPFGDGAVVLGGGRGGCRVVDADGAVRVLGSAVPNSRRAPYVAKDGVAWVGHEGRVWWLGLEAKAPVVVSGLGDQVDHVGGGKGVLYGAGADGVMRAANVTTPDAAVWTAPLGGRASGAPLRIDGGVYVLVGGRLVALDA